MSTIIDGTTGITTDGLIVGVEKAQLIKLETAQATTSGTQINFTGIPSWAKKITVMFNGVSTNGTSVKLIQIGSGSITTSGYTAYSLSLNSSGGTGMTNSTAGFPYNSNAAVDVNFGLMTLILINSNTWVSNHTIIQSASQILNGAGASSALSGALDRVRITTVNGTDTFDAGSINILIEGSL